MIIEFNVPTIIVILIYIDMYMYMSYDWGHSIHLYDTESVTMTSWSRLYSSLEINIIKLFQVNIPR